MPKVKVSGAEKLEDESVCLGSGFLKGMNDIGLWNQLTAANYLKG